MSDTYCQTHSINHMKYGDMMTKQDKQKLNKRFSARMSEQCAIKLEKIKMPKRKLLETAINEAYANQEDYEKLAKYYYYKEKLRQTEFELKELQATKDMIINEIKNIELELLENKPTIVKIRNPDLRSAIKTIQAILIRRRELYLSDKLSHEDMILNFIADNKSVIESTFRDNALTGYSEKDIKDVLLEYLEIK